MTYTDSDILDLFNDLQGVGLAQTPEEEAKAAHKALLDDYYSTYSDSRLPSESFLRSAQRRGIPHSYVVLLTNPDSSQLGTITVNVHPVVKDYVLLQGGITQIDQWSSKRQEFGNLVLTAQTLPALQDALFTIYEARPYLSPDKYSFLLEC